MTNLTIGNYIGIPCKVNPGPFEDEVLVEFESLDGTVSGFSRRENIQEMEGQSFIRGKVREVRGDKVAVMVEGSFFTTNGLATVTSQGLEPLGIAA